MVDHLHVLVSGRVAGRLDRRTRQAGVRLTYDDAYRADPASTPLSVSMPLQVRMHTGERVTNWLRGLLPENPAVLQRWSREFQVPAGDMLALLGSPVGRDCAGAVQFAPEDELDALLNRSGSITWLGLDDLATIVETLRADETAWLGPRTHRGQFSLAGAQSKITLVRDDHGRWGQPTGSAPSTHILKPGVQRAEDGTVLADQALNEHLTMDAARRAGLVVPPTEIHTWGEHRVVVVERYDRAWIDQMVIRVHQEDICQALGLPPEDKYESLRGPGVARIGKLLRTIMVGDARRDALNRFVDALAWNWFVAGTDAHAKNYSLLLQGRDVRFAPLYDLASAFPYWNARDRSLNLAMRLGTDYRVWPHANRWPAVAAQLRMDVDEVQTRVRELGARVPQAMHDAVADPRVVELDSKIPGQLAAAVEAHCAMCMSMVPASAG